MNFDVTIAKVLSYIETNLTHKITLEDIADVAGLSEYYFHRTFLSFLNIPPMEYIRKRRLSEAANDLLNTRKSILEIARIYQFESQESFTRAFYKQHAVNPGKLRRNKGPVAFFLPQSINNKICIIKKGVSMKPRIETHEAMNVVGLHCRTCQKNNTVPQLWDDFFKKYEILKDICDTSRSFGVCYYENMDNFDEETDFSYLAGFPLINENSTIPEGIESRIVPAAKYAIFEHKGSLETLNQTYENIFAKWLNENGLECDMKDQLELYDCRFKFGKDDSIMEIWIAVK